MSISEKQKHIFRNSVNIIPLGQNCMPRAILTRYGLKKCRFFGELTYPFDLAVFETREITKLVKSDFESFFDNLTYDKERKIWRKLPDCIEFVHENRFKKNDKDKLIEKYSKRIDNFRKAVKSDKHIIFIQVLGDCSDIENLYFELEKLRENKPFKYIVVDTQDITKPVKGIDILKLPFPSDEYKFNWWKKEYYNSSDGKNFEKQIADFVYGKGNFDY